MANASYPHFERYFQGYRRCSYHPDTALRRQDIHIPGNGEQGHVTVGEGPDAERLEVALLARIKWKTFMQYQDQSTQFSITLQDCERPSIGFKRQLETITSTVKKHQTDLDKDQADLALERLKHVTAAQNYGTTKANHVKTLIEQRYCTEPEAKDRAEKLMKVGFPAARVLRVRDAGPIDLDAEFPEAEHLPAAQLREDQIVFTIVSLEVTKSRKGKEYKNRDVKRWLNVKLHLVAVVVLPALEVPTPTTPSNRWMVVASIERDEERMRLAAPNFCAGRSTSASNGAAADARAEQLGEEAAREDGEEAASEDGEQQRSKGVAGNKRGRGDQDEEGGRGKRARVGGA